MLESGMPSCQPFIQPGQRGPWLKGVAAGAGLFVPQDELKPSAYIAERYPMPTELYLLAMKRLNKLLLRFDFRARLFDAAFDEFGLHF
jgi:hypothetical protein